MINTKNILLISDDDFLASELLNNLLLLRESDTIAKCSVKEAKLFLENSLCRLVIFTEQASDALTLKLFSTIKETQHKPSIILYLKEENPELILSAYDLGMDDFFISGRKSYEFLIKTINCIKLNVQKDLVRQQEKFLVQSGMIDIKTGFYQYKYISENFDELKEDLRIQNGYCVLITLDDSTKTKVSTNRLSLVLKNNLREDDIIISARGGKFYLILPNIDNVRTLLLLNKLQEKMGENIKLRAGIAQVGVRDFETLNNLLIDGLKSSILCNEVATCLEDKLNTPQKWLEDDNSKNKKDYKLFKKIYENKLQNIIIPNFYRFQKECETRLVATQAIQYANDIECVFCLKNDTAHSELILRYDGFAKFKIEVIHAGLDSPENIKTEITLKTLTTKYLNSMLKKLRDDYKSVAYDKDN